MAPQKRMSEDTVVQHSPPWRPAWRQNSAAAAVRQYPARTAASPCVVLSHDVCLPLGNCLRRSRAPRVLWLQLGGRSTRVGPHETPRCSHPTLPCATRALAAARWPIHWHEWALTRHRAARTCDHDSLSDPQPRALRLQPPGHSSLRCSPWCLFQEGRSRDARSTPYVRIICCNPKLPCATRTLAPASLGIKPEFRSISVVDTHEWALTRQRAARTCDHDSLSDPFIRLTDIFAQLKCPYDSLSHLRSRLTVGSFHMSH